MTWNTRVHLKPGPLSTPPALKSRCQRSCAAPIVALVDPHGQDLPPRLLAALAACLASDNYQARRRACAAAHTRLHFHCTNALGHQCNYIPTATLGHFLPPLANCSCFSTARP